MGVAHPSRADRLDGVGRGKGLTWSGAWGTMGGSPSRVAATARGLPGTIGTP